MVDSVHGSANSVEFCLLSNNQYDQQYCRPTTPEQKDAELVNPTPTMNSLSGIKAGLVDAGTMVEVYSQQENQRSFFRLDWMNFILDEI
uniref:Uncharacterized protein n=1 Tax=Physcomitrium patens TaxID=3218 RepID=A0A2K1KIG8_PHYPA|nr:hypothetical protein PHYPA_007245 [Physcomitrium patens]